MEPTANSASASVVATLAQMHDQLLFSLGVNVAVVSPLL